VGFQLQTLLNVVPVQVLNFVYTVHLTCSKTLSLHYEIYQCCISNSGKEIQLDTFMFNCVKIHIYIHVYDLFGGAVNCNNFYFLILFTSLHVSASTGHPQVKIYTVVLFRSYYAYNGSVFRLYGYMCVCVCVYIYIY
jgi:hypothetical protein